MDGKRKDPVGAVGNSVEILSDYFTVLDNTPPVVTLENIDEMAIGENYSIEWISSDNTELRSHHLYYSPTSLGNFTFIDSVDGAQYEYDWIVPNFVSNEARIRITTFDVIGLSDSDTSNNFAVIDTIIPVVNIISPTQGMNVLEQSNLYIEWVASDNIGLDYCQLYFSTNGGQQYTLIAELFDNETSFNYEVPVGLTDSALVRIDVFDTFGNHSNLVSGLFSVTDNTAPNVELVVIDQLFVGETYQIEWQAEDNLELSHHLLYFSENSTDSFNYIDSVAGSLLMYNWVVPDFISNDARIKIESHDTVDLFSTDTSNTFAVIDTIIPNIQIELPNSTSTVKENDSLLVFWQANDNIELDSIWINYGLTSSSNFVRVFEGLYVTNQQHIIVPPGISNESIVSVVVSDNSGNKASDLSNIFSVTDNTPPQVSITYPFEGDEFDINSQVDIVFTANDNQNVIGVGLSYKTDLDSNFIDIDYSINSDSTIVWYVPNKPTNNAQIRAIAMDEVGLMDTVILSNISINIVYPTVQSIFPDEGAINFLTNEMIVHFSEPMDLSTLSNQTVSISSNFENELSVTISYDSNNSSLILTNSSGYTSLDTIQIQLSGDQIRSLNGYNLDGNGDGLGGDDLTLEYEIGLSCDLNNDNKIDANDLIIFEDAWNNNQYQYELGPFIGEVPFTMIQTDSLFNIDDVMSFVLNANWYLQNHGLSFSSEKPEYPERIEVNNLKNIIEIDLSEEVFAYELVIEYDENVKLQINDNFSKSNIIYLDTMNTRLQTMSLKSEQKIQLPYEISRESTDIDIFIRLLSSNGSSIGEFYEDIEVKAIPNEFVLDQNYPNPFNPGTNIDFGLSKSGSVKLTIFDILGREVSTLVNTFLEEGYHSIYWDGINDKGKNVGGGVYFYMLRSEDNLKIRKMIFLK